MTEPPPLDPERIAALLDGRLDAAVAAPLGDELARADKEYRATFADAASVLAEVKRAADRTGGDGEPAFSQARWLAAAILCAVVALVIAVLIHRAATLTTATAHDVAGGHQYPWTSWMQLNDGYQNALQLSSRKGDNDFIERGMEFVRL